MCPDNVFDWTKKQRIANGEGNPSHDRASSKQSDLHNDSDCDVSEELFSSGYLHKMEVNSNKMRLAVATAIEIRQ